MGAAPASIDASICTPFASAAGRTTSIASSVPTNHISHGPVASTATPSAASARVGVLPHSFMAGESSAQTVLERLLARDPRREDHHPPHPVGVRRVQVGRPGRALVPRQEEDVRRRGRRHVPDRDELVVLVHPRARDLAAQDAGEDVVRVVGHGHPRRDSSARGS